MTLAEAEEIFAYWAESPPAHLMVQTIAAMLGWKKRPAARGGDGLAQIASAPPPGLTVAEGSAGMPAPIFDIDTLRAANRARAARREATE